MKLYTADNMELMEVSAIRAEGTSLIVVGTIMGAMPVEAILTPQELRQSLKLLSFKTIATMVKMLFSR